MGCQEHEDHQLWRSECLCEKRISIWLEFI